MYIGTIAIRSDTSFNWLLFAGCLVGLAVTLIVQLSYTRLSRQGVHGSGQRQNTPGPSRTLRSITIIGIIFCLFTASTTVLAHSATSNLSVTEKLQESLFEAGFDDPSVSPSATLDNVDFVGNVHSTVIKGHLVKRSDGVYDIYVDTPSKAPTTVRT